MSSMVGSPLLFRGAGFQPANVGPVGNRPIVDPSVVSRTYNRSGLQLANWKPARVQLETGPAQKPSNGRSMIERKLLRVQQRPKQIAEHFDAISPVRELPDDEVCRTPFGGNRDSEARNNVTMIASAWPALSNCVRRPSRPESSDDLHRRFADSAIAASSHRHCGRRHRPSHAPNGRRASGNTNSALGPAIGTARMPTG